MASEQPTDAAGWRELALAALDAKAKPPRSLGLLEDWAVRLCALQRSLSPSAAPAAALVFAADHGVTKTQAVRRNWPAMLT